MTAPFATSTEFCAILAQAQTIDEAARTAAAERNAQLTKPAGSLGRLEDLAIWYAGWRGDARPALAHPQVAIFAGNHGVAALGVSAFPAEVTAQMVGGFQAGFAAVNQLARSFGAKISVHPIDLETPTADFTQSPAMSEAELVAALTVGWNAVDPQADLFVAGEMGIGNTTPAAAIGAALFGGTAQDWVGRGTGVDDAGLQRKAEVVQAGLDQHRDALDNPIEVLRRLGGREIAAMAGAIASARAKRIPVILDGFICCAAAAVLERIQPGALDHTVAGHQSAESAHVRLLDHLNKDPILSLNLRLGEASGATLAIGVLQGAIATHSGMATFAEAGVSTG